MNNPPSPSLDRESSTALSVHLDEIGPLDADRPVREGLPSTFRMRADAHYVESLDTRAADADAVPRGRIRAQKPAEDTSPGIAAVEAASELRRSLATLAECPDLFDDGVSELARRTALPLLRAEVWRTTWLIRAAAVLRGEIPLNRKRTAVDSLVPRVLQAVEPERRLRSIVLHRQMTVSNSYIVGDEDLLICALSGVLMATMRLVDDTSMPVSVVARVDPAGEFAFAVTQESATPEFQQSEGFGAVALATAGRIVEAYRGRLTLRARDYGSEIHIAIPAAN